MTKTATAAAVKTGKVAQIKQPNQALEFIDHQFSEPAERQVRIKIQACGICHSDSFPLHGGFPGQVYPIVPGHEIVGIIDAVGSEVTRLKAGERVGVGWHGGHCHQCQSCRKGDFITCANSKTPGININGGYAEYGIFDESACAVVPESLSASEAAPLLCAGVTTFNALRHAGAVAGDTVAVLGMGGLGHLGVQFAAKMGFNTVAVARGDEKSEFAHKLGAHHYINSEASDAVDKLNKMGGAKVVLSTITSSKAMTPWINALAVDGRLVLLGADVANLEVSPIALIGARRTIAGWPSGTAADSEDCLRFAAITGVRPLIEPYPFEKAADGLQRMLSSKARFRVVLEFK